ncbi:MAG: ISAs1 family transposase [Deltaproteobacteria bacterium]|nr:ISAs1 family transposase [Deltaproteobacteria bacterium]
MDLNYFNLFEQLLFEPLMFEPLLPEPVLLLKGKELENALQRDPEPQYPLRAVITITVKAICAGCNSWEEIRRYAELNADYFMDCFPALDSIPSVEAIKQSATRLDWASVVENFPKVSVELIKRLHKRAAGKRKIDEAPQVISIFGKPAHGVRTGCGEDGVKFHLINAVCGLVTLSSKKVEKKSDEATVLPKFIYSLFRVGLLRGRVVTNDTLGFKRNIADLILKYWGHYFFPIKTTQKYLFERALKLFQVDIVKHPRKIIRQDCELDRSQSETVVSEKVTVIYLNGFVRELLSNSDLQWGGVNTITQIEKVSLHKKTYITSKELKYFVSSLNLPILQMLDVLRKHNNAAVTLRKMDEIYKQDKVEIYTDSTVEFFSLIRRFAASLILSVSRQYDESAACILQLMNISQQYYTALFEKPVEELGPPKMWRHKFGPKIVSD